MILMMIHQLIKIYVCVETISMNIHNVNKSYSFWWKVIIFKKCITAKEPHHFGKHLSFLNFSTSIKKIIIVIKFIILQYDGNLCLYKQIYDEHDFDNKKNHHFDLITKINLFYEKINYCDENHVRCKVLRLRWKFILVRWKFSIVIEIQYCDGNYFWWNLFIVMSGVNLGIKTISAKLKLSWQYSKLKLRNARLFCPLRSWKRNKFSDLEILIFNFVLKRGVMSLHTGDERIRAGRQLPIIG